MFRLILKLSLPLSIVLGVIIGITIIYGESLSSWRVVYASRLNNGFWTVNEMNIARHLHFTHQIFPENFINRPLISPNRRYLATTNSISELSLYDRQTDIEYILEASFIKIFSFSSDSRYLLIYLVDHYQLIEIFDDNSISEPQIIASDLSLSLEDTLLAWSPNSDMLLFELTSNMEEQPNLYLYSVERDEIQNLTAEIPSIQNHSPTWSSDGQTIAYIGRADDLSRESIHTIDIDGTNHQQVMMIPQTIENIEYMRWSPDGRYFAVVAHTGQFGYELYVFPSEGNDKLMPPIDQNWGASELMWSEDSDQIMFINAQTYDIHLVNTDGSFLTRLTYIDDYNTLLP